jgi:hypothetical protein
MPSADFFSYLSKSLDLLKDESRENYGRLAAELKSLRINIRAGKAARVAYFADGEFAIEAAGEHADIWLEFDEGAILNVIDGKSSLEDAVLDGAIFVRGGVQKIEILYGALVVYLDGAMRSPGFPTLLSNYRQDFSSGG